MLHRVDYFGFVYIWGDREARRFYIGSHYGSTTDTYISSSRWMKAAYYKRPQAFKRRILAYLVKDDKALLHQLEQTWLDLIPDDELGKRYYNLKKHAAGGNGSANKGKTKKGWIEGTTKEMWSLRRQGLFCLLSCDKPKPKPSKAASRPTSRNHTKILRADCEHCGKPFWSRFNLKTYSKHCSKECRYKRPVLFHGGAHTGVLTPKG